MELNKILEWPLFTFSAVRSAHYTLQYDLLNRLSKKFPGLKAPQLADEVVPRELLRTMLLDFIKTDVKRCAEGYFPISVYQPESPMKHAKRVAKIFLDGLSLYRRRANETTHDFSKSAQDYFGDVPEYFQRNFHFQTDGYLSEHSADLYEHQVELLFGGTGEAMRRILIKPMKDFFKKQPDGAGLHLLEIGAGVGSATRNIKLAFPKARITVTDVSEPYLRTAQKTLEPYKGLDFFRADGGKLPFESNTFDAVYTVFVLHETPLEARNAILSEMARVTKPGGFVGVVDSGQLGDVPELDEVFKSFPLNFHEPFYTNYIKTPIEELLKAQKLDVQGSEMGFFSKVTWAKKAAHIKNSQHEM